MIRDHVLVLCRCILHKSTCICAYMSVCVRFLNINILLLLMQASTYSEGDMIIRTHTLVFVCHVRVVCVYKCVYHCSAMYGTAAVDANLGILNKAD